MTKNQRKLVNAIRNLNEIDSRLSRNADLKSLSTGKMSNFLFEEEGVKTSRTKEGDGGSKTDVIKNLKDAVEALNEEIAGLEKVGQALNSDSIEKIAADLNGKLVKIQLGKDIDFKNITQTALKQTVYLANGVSRARLDIKTAVSAALAALKTMGVPLDAEEKINEIIPENPDADKPYKLKVQIKQEEFKQGIIKKLGESGKSGVISFFKNVFGGNNVKLDKSVVINAELFAQDILFNSPSNLSNIYKQPIVADPEKTKVDDNVKAAAEAAPKEATSGGKSAEESSSKEDKKATPKMTDLLQLKKDNKEAGQNLKQTLGRDKWVALPINFREKPADVLNVLNDILPALKDADIIKYESKVKQQQLILERLNELAGTSSKKN
jgi:hypothetical protein